MTPDAVLSDEDVDRALAERGLRWDRQGATLVKAADRGDFAGALAYVNEVGRLAEEANHHPDIDVRWKSVTLRLSTHSAGGITGRDLELAARIDQLDGAEA